MRSRPLKAFVLGAAASAVLLHALVTLVLLLERDAVYVGLGPVLVVSRERVTGGTETTFGTGLLLLSVAGGLLNAAAAGILERRAGGGSMP